MDDKPIETAPKDGSRMLLWHGVWTIGRWAERFSPDHFEDTSPGWFCPELGRRIAPTRWTPLPATSSKEEPDNLQGDKQ